MALVMLLSIVAAGVAAITLIYWAEAKRQNRSQQQQEQALRNIRNKYGD